MEIEVLTLEEAQELAETNPCFSMMALTTLLIMRGYYPLPLDFDEQASILSELSDQIEKPFEDVLDDELQAIQNSCLQSDIDFSFVIDSSGSVGPSNWEITMQMIGDNWIKETLVPSGSKTCGNHVAGRWFSHNTERFFDFEPPSKDVYANFDSFAEYQAAYFTNIWFQGGGTETALALRETRLKDIPMAREGGLKYVMVFTDGVSWNASATEAAAELLHGVVDRTYAFGIGDAINMDELYKIGSSEEYVARMTDFTDLEAFVRKFIIEQKGCATTNKQAYRAIDLNHVTHYGMSHQTANELNDQVDVECTQSAVCPKYAENNRHANCTRCSVEIGLFELAHPQIIIFFSFKPNCINPC